MVSRALARMSSCSQCVFPSVVPLCHVGEDAAGDTLLGLLRQPKLVTREASEREASERKASE
jgi:hypothetical protein